jgi:hypothetical protein
MRLTIEVQELDTPQKVAFNKIMMYYGAGCFPQSTEDKGDFYRVPIGIHYPSSIIDEKTETEKIFTFHFKDIGEFLLKKSTLKVTSRPSIRAISDCIRERRKEVSKKVEKDLIRVMGDPNVGIKFGVFKYAQLGIQPIYRTITRLLETPDKFPLRSWVEKIGYQDLANLIVNSGYAKYNEEQRLTPSNELHYLLDKQKGDTRKTCEAVVGIVLSQNFDYLYQTKRIIHFVPYVRASSTYYTEALQYGSLIRMSEQRLLESVRKYYRLTPQLSQKARFGYPTMIRELLDAEVLCSEDGFITGRQDIFDKLSHLREDLPMSEPAYSARSS